MIRVLCFGNPLLDNDSLAIKVARNLSLPGVSFEECYDMFEIFDYKPDFLLDVGINVSKPLVVDDSSLLTNPIISLHDFDLAFFLKLFKSLGKDFSFKIIILPTSFSFSQASSFLQDFFKKESL